jgi:rhodanese-related sulfurtransferase
MATTTQRGSVRSVNATTLNAWLSAGEAVLVDVRAPALHAAERIPGARSIPADRLEPARLEVPAGRRLVLHCEIGVASAQAARRLVEAGLDDVYNLESGIAGWKDAGLPVESTPGAPLPIIRQVQIVAGSLVVLGTALGAAVSPWFLLLSGFVGAGLVFAGATGICGMAALLLRLPHNRRGCAPGSAG